MKYVSTQAQIEVSRIAENVANALTAIAEKGVTVPDGSGSDLLAALIRDIEMGGALPSNIKLIDGGSFTQSGSSTTSKTLTNIFGEAPNFFIVLSTSSFSTSNKSSLICQIVLSFNATIYQSSSATATTAYKGYITQVFVDESGAFSTFGQRLTQANLNTYMNSSNLLIGFGSDKKATSGKTYHWAYGVFG